MIWHYLIRTYHFFSFWYLMSLFVPIFLDYVGIFIFLSDSSFFFLKLKNPAMDQLIRVAQSHHLNAGAKFKINIVQLSFLSINFPCRNDFSSFIDELVLFSFGRFVIFPWRMLQNFQFAYCIVLLLNFHKWTLQEIRFLLANH